MATITKTLSAKVNKTTGKAEVLLRFVGGRGLYYRAKSGLYIEPSKWSTKTQRGKQSATDPELIAFNAQLADLEKTICNAFAQVTADNQQTWLQDAIELYHHPELQQAQPTQLLAFIDTFVKSSESRQVNGKFVTKGTRKQYVSGYNHLKGYAEACGVEDFTFDQIDETFYNGFIAYLQGLNESTNNIGKLIKLVKVYVHAAPKELQDIADLSKFRTIHEQADNIYLTEDELATLEACDLSFDNRLDRVRDAFLLLAWTGCRYSDLDKVTPNNIKGGMLQLRQQKTGALVTIPLHPSVKRIFDKYDNNLPTPYCEQFFNRAIKEVCAVAGLDGAEKKTITKGGKIVTREMTKAEMVGSHTGRRSFATNMYKRGVPSLTIMAITGHTTETSFLKYIKVTKEEHAQRMADLWQNFYN